MINDQSKFIIFILFYAFTLPIIMLQLKRIHYMYIIHVFEC